MASHYDEEELETEEEEEEEAPKRKRGSKKWKVRSHLWCSGFRNRVTTYES